MNYNKIRIMDISNGPGVRVSIFVQGCTFNCEGCFNPETHDFTGGKEFTKSTLNKLIELCNRDEIRGLSILGGEPLHLKNISKTTEIARTFRLAYPNKDLWIWTGFLFENKQQEEIMQYIDVLVDGRFEIQNKDIRLKYAGSNNQRVIDVQKSLKENKIILYK